VKEVLKNVEELPEYKSAYLMAVFILEAKKQIPLMVHKLPNDKEIILPADTKQNEVKELLNKIQR
jgi:hypothetical protein